MNFGKTEKEFSPPKLQNLILAGEIDKAKAYILRYFCRLACPPSTVLFWSPTQSKKKLMSYKDTKETFIPDLRVGDVKTGIFSIRQWFFGSEQELYYIDVDPHQPPIFKRKGATFINLFEGYKWQTEKKFSKFSNDAKNGVKVIWNHIKTAWCSNNKKLFKYVKH